MNAVIRALTDYLSACGYPLYLADAVPERTPFPYLTAELRAPLSPSDTGALTLTVWCAGDSANAKRMSIHDALMQHFPARGVCLSTAQGRAVLRPGAAACVESGAALGVSIPLDIRFFPTA